MNPTKYIVSAAILLTISTGSVFAQCLTKELSQEEIGLANDAGIDFGILQLLRLETDSSFSRLTSTSYVFSKSANAYTRETNLLKGVVFGADAESAYNLVFKLREKFLKLGHLIFICEKDKTNNKYKIAIIKSTDQLDIVRIMQTNGENYNIFNEDVVNKLVEWNAEYPFNIIGASSDWLEAVFVQAPPATESFANEVYQFCPDVVDSGSGSVKYLAQEMNDTGMLYLWWQ